MITLNVNGKELDFEHSLTSLSEWESYFAKPFYITKKDEKRDEKEWEKYFELMYVGPRKRRHMLKMLNEDHKLVLVNYVITDRTATTIREIQKSRGVQENITSELIYYWLTAFRIPFKPTDEWHLSRLLMLVRVCSAKQAPPPKGRQNKKQLAESFRELNERRRRELGTSG